MICILQWLKIIQRLKVIFYNRPIAKREFFIRGACQRRGKEVKSIKNEFTNMIYFNMLERRKEIFAKAMGVKLEIFYDMV